MTAPRGEFDLELPGQGSVTRWTLRLAAVTMLVGGLVLIFLLVQATNNRLLYERYFTRLLWVNIAAAVVLALAVIRSIVGPVNTAVRVAAGAADAAVAGAGAVGAAVLAAALAALAACASAGATWGFISQILAARSWEGMSSVRVT